MHFLQRQSSYFNTCMHIFYHGHGGKVAGLQGDVSGECVLGGLRRGLSIYYIFHGAAQLFKPYIEL